MNQLERVAELGVGLTSLAPQGMFNTLVEKLRPEFVEFDKSVHKSGMLGTRIKHIRVSVLYFSGKGSEKSWVRSS